MCDLRKNWRFKDGFDDPGVDGQDGQHHTGQEDQRELIDVLHTDEHHESHERQTARPINTHVIQQSVRLLRLLLRLKDSSAGNDVRLWHNTKILYNTIKRKSWGKNGNGNIIRQTQSGVFNLLDATNTKIWPSLCEWPPS